MNPVLAQQEIHVIDLRRQLQAEVERDQHLRMQATRSQGTDPVGPLGFTGVRAWFRAAGARAASFGPQATAAVAKERASA